MTNYKDFLPEKSTRTRENIEWAIFYSFNAPDEKSPRTLVVGDSINYQYKDALRDKLADKVNITSWASSKCVTDVTYLKDFDYVLEYNRYDLITFNNGIHYLTVPTSFDEWERAYRRTLEFIMAKHPAIPLALVLCTPIADDGKNAVVKKLNSITLQIAEDFKLPVIDLYSPMDKLDRNEFWNDLYHFKPSAIEIQADIMAEWISNKLSDVIADHNDKLFQAGSATGPSGAVR